MARCFLKVFLLTAFLITAVQSSALAAYKNLTFVNNTGRTIKSILIGGGDCLGGGCKTLPNADSHTIQIRDDIRDWEIIVVFADDGKFIRYNLDLSGVWKVTFHRQGSDYKATTADDKQLPAA